MVQTSRRKNQSQTMARSKQTPSKGNQGQRMTKDQVYFDPRQSAEQQIEDMKEAVAAALKIEEEEQEKLNNVEMGKSIVAGLGTLFISPLVLMVVWNIFMPGLFALPVLTYWTSMGLIVISRLLIPKND